jgi:CheY-like chemotaxis protein
LDDSGIATRRIKPDPGGQAIPIIVVTAYALTGEESESGPVVMTKYLCSISVILCRGTGQ